MLVKQLASKVSQLRSTLKVPVRRAHDYGVADFKHPTMNELPVPSGSWQEHYNKKNARYNMQMAAGIAFFATTVTIIFSQGIIQFYNTPKLTEDK